MYWRWCSLVAQTVRGPAAGAGLPYIEPDGPLVRRGSSDHQQHLDLAPRDGPRQGGEILGLSGVCRPLKTPPDDIESKRGKDGDGEGYVTATPRAKSKGMKDRLIWFNFWCVQLVVPLHIYRGSFEPVTRRSPIESVVLDG
jgi:hypothetical protein